MKTCKECGSASLEALEAAGTTYCVDCGVVVEENAIVSEVTFGEASNGAATCHGQLISYENTRGRFRNSSGYLESESSETTISNARQKASEIASGLKIASHLTEQAVAYFKLALRKNLTRGRRSEVTVSACLYIACRYKKTSHMLIDFSDIVQASVFSIGKAFLFLRDALNLQDLPIVDPSFYMARFASLCDFGDETKDVLTTAMRLAKRMGRDWMVEGRRPAGICGACLVLAARIHHFSRSPEDLQIVVKVSATTIKKRLIEFSETPSGQLTVGEFLDVDLEDAADPPAFKRARLFEEKEKEQQESSLKSSADKEFVDSQKSICEALRNEIKEFLDTCKEQDITEEPLPEDDLSILDDDDEIKGIFLDEDEVKVKTEFWMDENADYLDAQEAKLRREALGIDQASKKRPRVISYSIF
ncbi:transcription factor TFIIIB subunit brf1 [Entomophthora muscae]|uniref:Transcription factor TFIIIB subunit brf1 n=1 Tax=Entomophthora muscae TaxID=34485 RepID=A0ACC2S8H6_9FUNG|nr:transcription factor TFIIIB subunit brf1 [Entomophthora muscae]